MVQKILGTQLYDVLLTRTQDTTLSLIDRSEFSNRTQADLYISLHANASPTPSKTSHGIETYYVDFPTSTPPTRDVGYLSLGVHNDHLAKKIESEYFKKNTNASQLLAQTVHHTMIKHLQKTNKTIGDRGVKTAPLKNLLRSVIPTIYVEVGFLSHQEEARKLATQEHQKKLAEGISYGIQEFIKNYQNVSL